METSERIVAGSEKFSFKVDSEDFVKNLFSNFYAHVATKVYMENPLIPQKMRYQAETGITAMLEKNLKSGRISQTEFDDSTENFKMSIDKLIEDYGKVTKLIGNIRNYWFYSKADESKLYQDVKSLEKKAEASLNIPPYIREGYDVLTVGLRKKDLAVSYVLSDVSEITPDTQISPDKLRAAVRSVYRDRDEYMRFNKDFGMLDMKLFMAIGLISESSVKKIKDRLAKSGNPITEDHIFRTNLNSLNRDYDGINIIAETYVDQITSKHAEACAKEIFTN